MKCEDFVAVMGYEDLLGEPLPPNPREDARIACLLDAADQQSYARQIRAIGVALKPEIETEVNCFLEKIAREERSAQALRLVHHKDELSREVVLHETEMAKLREIVAALAPKRGRARGVVVESRAHFGGRFLIHHLPAVKDFQALYPGGVWHVRADRLLTLDEPADAPRLADELEGLLREVQDPISGSGSYNPRVLLKSLASQRQLLVVHNLSALPPIEGRPHSAFAVIERLSSLISSELPNTSPVPLLVNEWPRSIRLAADRFNTLKLDPRITSGEARDYFDKMLNHYRGERRMAGEGPLCDELLSNDWPRKKRIDWHYHEIGRLPDPENSGTGERAVTPASVRFRAICLSNARNFSCHDATQGFNRMVGPGLLGKVPEVETINEDIVALLQSGTLTEPEVDALRLISTGVYFFSKGMLERLWVARGDDKRLHAIKIHGSLDFVSHMSGRDDAFVMSQIVRAAIQDEWIQTDSHTRTQWHAAIAHDLAKAFHDDQSLRYGPADPRDEFPVQPPWNDGRILFATEAVRHYVRAFQSHPDGEPDHVHSAHKIYRELGESFDTDRSDDPKPRSLKTLSRATGQYRLKIELLGLLSKNGDAMNPEPALGLNPINVAYYHLEVGKTYAVLLNLQNSQKAFERGLEIVGEDQCLTCARARLMLFSHQITSFLEAGAFKQALAVQLRMRGDIERLKNMGGDPNVLSRERARRIARLAAILTAKSRSAQSIVTGKTFRAWAIQLFRVLCDDEMVPRLQGERALGFLDALIEPAAAELARSSTIDIMEQTEAWILCEQLQSTSLDVGNQFQNLAFETRRARIVRRSAVSTGGPQVAEAILDRVGIALGRFGGSEKEFKEFQIESAATLISLGRPRYALAAYALPARDQLEGTSAEALKRRLQAVIDRASSELDRNSGDAAPFVGAPNYRELYIKTTNGQDPFYSLPLLPPERILAMRLAEIVAHSAESNPSHALGED